jgi:gamma-glutamyltranspeptidase/glutathione hydrolase
LVTPFHYQHTVESLSGIKKGNASPFLLGPGKVPLAVGERLKQPQLARTLSILSGAGFKDFYHGDIAREIIKDMQRNKGFICADDFSDLPYPQETEPVRGHFFGMDIYSLPPPGDGTTLIQMLQVFDHLKGSHFDPDTPEAAELFARIIQKARRERRKYRLGAKSASGRAVDRASIEYALNISEKIKTHIYPAGETSHFCVMDSSGNVVSATQSIERSFGSKVASETLGFLYNGYMKGFKIQNKRHPHYLKPGAIARSNAAPTILFQGNRPFAAIGSTGSERMSSGIFETLVRLQYKTPFESVSAPRLHCTPEGEILIEAERFSPETLDLLKGSGFLINPLDAWSFSTGGLQLIVFDGKTYVGVGEPRRDGAAAGPDNICG